METDLAAASKRKMGAYFTYTAATAARTCLRAGSAAAGHSDGALGQNDLFVLSVCDCVGHMWTVRGHEGSSDAQTAAFGHP